MSDDLRLLYIDDSVTQLAAVKMKLKSLGIDVAITHDLATAERMVDGRDLVIVDFHMPQADGAETVARLRKQRGAEKALFYLYTSDRDVAAEYGRHGFDGAFTQKGSLDELARQVGNVGKLIRMRRAMPSSSKVKR